MDTDVICARPHILKIQPQIEPQIQPQIQRNQKMLEYLQMVNSILDVKIQFSYKLLIQP